MNKQIPHKLTQTKQLYLNHFRQHKATKPKVKSLRNHRNRKTIRSKIKTKRQMISTSKTPTQQAKLPTIFNPITRKTCHLFNKLQMKLAANQSKFQINQCNKHWVLKISPSNPNLKNKLKVVGTLMMTKIWTTWQRELQVKMRSKIMGMLRLIL